MPYKKKTPFFGIPIPAKGDKVLSLEEEKTRNIIENQLLASTKGVRSAIFEEGFFKLIDNNDGSYSVALAQTRGTYALCGLVGGGYVESKEPILWDNLDAGTTYYLYVQYTEGMYENPGNFRTVSSISSKDNDSLFLLVASVDLKSATKTINSNPTGKVYSRDISKHHCKETNPHGEVLQQDTLIVNKKLTSKSLESSTELSLKDKRVAVDLSDGANVKLETVNQSIVGAINELVGSEKTTYIEMDSGASAGVAFSVPNANEVLFVNYMRISNGTKQLGEMTFTINKSNVTMYNTGDIGIKLRLQVLYK